jgi:hypothetical protein
MQRTVDCEFSRPYCGDCEVRAFWDIAPCSFVGVDISEVRITVMMGDSTHL